MLFKPSTIQSLLSKSLLSKSGSPDQTDLYQPTATGLQPLSQLVTQFAQRRVIFVGGKGGVGKTTTAAALASAFASLGHKTLIVSTDPAHSLGDVLQQPLDNQAQCIIDNLYALELNPDEIVDAHFEQVERTIRGYASPDMMPKIREHLQVAKVAPGAVEAAMLEAVCQQMLDAQTQGYEHVIFDTAPTGHTLRLLMLPEMMQAWTDGLLVQQRRQAKLKSVALSLQPGENRQQPSNQSISETDNHPCDQPYSTTKADAQFASTAFRNPFVQHKPDRWQQAVAALEARKHLFATAGKLLHDPNQCGIVLVMLADNLPILETKRSVAQLRQSHLPPQAIVINQLLHSEQSDDFWQQRATRQSILMNDILDSFADMALYPIYLQQQDILGHHALSALLMQVEDLS